MTFTLSILGAINLNKPGGYLHWSIFVVSEANLVLIAVMVVIFGAALLIPFPHRDTEPGPAPVEPTNGAAAVAPRSAGDLGDDADAAMWSTVRTGGRRRRR